jgi:hypothetical protein
MKTSKYNLSHYWFNEYLSSFEVLKFKNTKPPAINNFVMKLGIVAILNYCK